jgi:hypothetical protein
MEIQLIGDDYDMWSIPLMASRLDKLHAAARRLRRIPDLYNKNIIQF